MAIRYTRREERWNSWSHAARADLERRQLDFELAD